MIGASYGTVEDIEIFWTVVSLVGFVFAALNAKYALSDYRLLKENNINHGLKLVTRGLVVSELGRAYVQLVFFCIGVTVMCLPANPETQFDIRALAGILIRWGLLTCAIVIMGKSIHAWYIRVRSMEELANDEGVDKWPTEKVLRD